MKSALTEKFRTQLKNGGRRTLPLWNGEHLSLAEFEKRWDATPNLVRAELIEGIVFMAPPTSETHSCHHGEIGFYLSQYALATPGTRACINASVRIDNRNELQPDALLRIGGASMGRSKLAEDDVIEGAPELVAEIAVTSVGYDAHEKRLVYERAGVQEYMLWQVMDARCDWWELHDGLYQPLRVQADHIHRSRVFPGLWLDLPALLAGDHRKVQRALQRGLKSDEHSKFVRKLKPK